MLAHAGSDEWQDEVEDIARLVGLEGLQFWVRNASRVTAEDVNIRLELPAEDGLEMIGEQDHPKYGAPGIHAPFGTADVTQVNGRWRVDARLGKLQPQEEEYAGAFLLRATRKLDLDGVVRVSADHLPEPLETRVRISRDALGRSISYYDARELREHLLR